MKDCLPKLKVLLTPWIAMPFAIATGLLVYSLLLSVITYFGGSDSIAETFSKPIGAITAGLIGTTLHVLREKFAKKS